MIKTILTASIFLFNAANAANAAYDCNRVQFPSHAEGYVTLPDDDFPYRIRYTVSKSSAVKFTLNQGIKSKDGAYCLAVTNDEVLIASIYGRVVFRLFTTDVSFDSPMLEFALVQNFLDSKSLMTLTYYDENQHTNRAHYQEKFWNTNETGIGSIELRDNGQLVFDVNGKVMKTVGLIDPDASGEYCSHVQFPVRTVGDRVGLPDHSLPHRIWFFISTPSAESIAVLFTVNQGLKSENGAYCLAVTNNGVLIASKYGQVVFRLVTTNVSLENPELWLSYQQNWRQSSTIWLTYEEKWQDSYYFPYKYGQRISTVKKWTTNVTGIGTIRLSDIGQLVFDVDGKVIDRVGLIDPDASGESTTKRLLDIKHGGISPPNGICNVIVVNGVLKLTTPQYNVRQMAAVQELYTIFQRDSTTVSKINPQIRITNKCELQTVYDDNVLFITLYEHKNSISRNEFLNYGQKLYSWNFNCVLQMGADGYVIIYGAKHVEPLFMSNPTINHQRMFLVTDRKVVIVEAKLPGIHETFSGNMDDYRVLKTFVDRIYFHDFALTDNCDMILQDLKEDRM